MKAEHGSHAGHDRLVSPRQIPSVMTDAGIEVQGQEVADCQGKENQKKKIELEKGEKDKTTK